MKFFSKKHHEYVEPDKRLIYVNDSLNTLYSFTPVCCRFETQGQNSYGVQPLFFSWTQGYCSYTPKDKAQKPIPIKLESPQISDGLLSNIFDPGWIGSAIFGLGLENFP